MYRPERSWTHVRRHRGRFSFVFRGGAGGGVGIDLGDFLVTEEDIEGVAGGSGSERDRVASEGDSDCEGASIQPDLAASLDFADQVAGVVLDGRQ